MRALHVVSTLARGGLENWVSSFTRSVKADCSVDILTVGSGGVLEDELRAAGARIFHGGSPLPNPLRHARTFLSLLKENGPYDVLHVHAEPVGFWLALGFAACVPRRIAHAHTSCLEMRLMPRWFQWATWPVTQALLHLFATRGIAPSEVSARARFGSRRGRWQVIPCGIDFDSFRRGMDRRAMRGELGIDDKTLVLGHVGRLETIKNHDHILDMASAALVLDQDIRFVLVGDGPRRAELMQAVARRGLSTKVTLLGERADVARCLSAFDVFVFPSWAEGLPLAVLEAQACGIPCLVSDRVDRGVQVVPQLVQFVSPSATGGEWLRLARQRTAAGVSVSDRRAAFVAAACEIGESARRVLSLYHPAKCEL